MPELQDYEAMFAQLQAQIAELREHVLELEEAGGWEDDVLVGGAAHTHYKELFGLYDRTATTLKIRRSIGKGAAVAGVWVGVGNGSASFDTAITIGDNTWIYLKVHRTTSGGSATLEKVTGALNLPDGDEDDEIFPLWYVPFADGEITAADIVDHRYATHWVAGV